MVAIQRKAFGKWLDWAMRVELWWIGALPWHEVALESCLAFFLPCRATMRTSFCHWRAGTRQNLPVLTLRPWSPIRDHHALFKPLVCDSVYSSQQCTAVGTDLPCLWHTQSHFREESLRPCLNSQRLQEGGLVPLLKWDSCAWLSLPKDVLSPVFYNPYFGFQQPLWVNHLPCSRMFCTQRSRLFPRMQPSCDAPWWKCTRVYLFVLGSVPMKRLPQAERGAIDVDQGTTQAKSFMPTSVYVGGGGSKHAGAEGVHLYWQLRYVPGPALNSVLSLWWL